MKERIICVNLILVCLIIFSCAKKVAVKKPPPVIAPVKVSTKFLIDRIPFSEIRTIKSEIKVTINSEGESKGPFSGILLYSHPDRLHMKVFGPLWFTLVEILYDRGFLQILIPLKNTLYRDTVPFHTLMPDRTALDKSTKLLEETDDMYILYILDTQKSADQKQPLLQKAPDLILKAKYFFSKKDLSLQGVELFRDMKKQTGIEFYTGEEIIPARIGLHISGTSLHLELKDVKLNEELKDEYFKPLKATQTLPLSNFLMDFDPNQ